MKIVFMGTPQAAVPTLERIISDGHEVISVYCQPDRPSGRGNKVTFSPVKQFAEEKGLAILQPQKIRTGEAIGIFRAHKADVAVVVAYGRILPEEFLPAFPQGAINLHFSLLPKYRGAAPVNWAIANGETETGVTTMRMDAGLDTGPILRQRSTKIGEDETAVELMERLSIDGAQLLSETLADLASIHPVKQDESQARYAPILKREDGLIDWNLSAPEIANRVRGFQPFPTTFTHHAGKRVTVWRAHPERTLGEKNVNPGSVVEARHDQLTIACGGASALKIEELQLEGKRRMSARDFLNGVKLTEGEILG